MKISVRLTVDLHDPEQWTTAFGVESREEIREDVRLYVETAVRSLGVFDGEVAADVYLAK